MLQTTPAGRDLARKFEVTSSFGLVISDRTGGHQAFWHEGMLTADALEGYLTKYADPQRPLVTTETSRPASWISYYPQTVVPSIHYSPSYVPSGQAIPCRT